jgi:hypothetical protein
MVDFCMSMSNVRISHIMLIIEPYIQYQAFNLLDKRG